MKKTKKDLITTRLLLIIIFGSLIVLCMNSASASSSASGDHIYVNGSSGSDSNDGLTPQTAKLTIKNATGTVNTGGTVSISDGTFSGAGNTNIVINRDMTITGAGKTKTIISGSDSSRIFVINNNVNFILKNLTITSGSSNCGGAILNQGHTTVDNSAFTQCKTFYTFMGGGSAIANTDDGTLIVTNTDFLNNDARASSSSGGTIYTNGTLTINNCSFTANIAYNGGCVFSYGGNINIANSSFINNTATNGGGILTLYGADNNLQIHFCSFVGNMANTITTTNNIDNRLLNSMNVNSCWWGSNAGPNGIAGPYIADNWIYMVLSSDKSSIKYGKSTKVTADFNNLYDIATATVKKLDPAVNHIPDGLFVDFSTDLGQITTPGTTEDGTATAVFTGTHVGTATVNATSGSQTVSSTVTVEPLGTTTTVDDGQNYPGQDIKLTAHVTDENNNPVNGGYVTFTVNDSQIEVQVVNGVATLSWTIPSDMKAGMYSIDAYYDGTGTIYGESGASANLKVLLIPTTISSDDVTGEIGDKVPIKAHLEDKFGNAMEGQKVTFHINNTDLTGYTDANGDVTVYYTIAENPGAYNILISFPGTNQYEPSTYTSKLTVNRISTSIKVPNTKGVKGDHVDLQAELKDKNGNPLVGKEVVFSVNGSKVGSARTNNDGIATFSYLIDEIVGEYTIKAVYMDDPIYQDATGQGTLTVNPLDTKITVNNVNGKHKDKTHLTALLTDYKGNPLAGKTVTFSINGDVIGKAATDSSGTATISYTISQTIGSYIITATFLKDDIYASSTGKGTLTVNPIDTNLTIKDVKGHHGEKVNLKAVLTDENGNTLTGKNVVFYISGKKIGTAVTDATGTASLSYIITQTLGDYVIYANSLADDIYSPSRNLATLTVSMADTTLAVKNVTVKHGNKANLTAVLTDKNGSAVAGKTITFSINNQIIGNATTDSTGTAVIYYMENNSGNFDVKAMFNGDDLYSGANGTGKLNVIPWAGLYIKTTTNNTNPRVGETFTINYKLGNNGPDTAYNVVMSFKIPAGLEFITGTTDNGSWSFDPVTRTLTWTLNSVVVGDPNLKITLKALESGNYTIIPAITANTTTNITQNGTINIEVLNNNKNNTNGTGNNTNHSTKLPDTGLPIAPLIAGLLMVIGGIAVKK
ncbi:MAG: hypothetical protein F8N15_04790 [Methanobacterium sp.]|nr:hypothetical protein [Methanobacterium sp.]